MRHLRLSLGLLAATSALALGATPAFAHEFIASRTGKTHGVAESEQAFKFGAFKIKCQKANAKGAVAAGGSSTYATAIYYTKCLTSAFVGTGLKHQIFLPTKWLTPLAVEYHANGFVETGSELGEVEGKTVVTGGSAEILVKTGKTEEFEKSECTISIPPQTIPTKATKEPEGEFTAATYSNATQPHKVTKAFPDGLEHYIVISNAFKGIKAEFSGEPCEEWGKEEGPESFGGTYTGSFPQFLSMGNLEYQ